MRGWPGYVLALVFALLGAVLVFAGNPACYECKGVCSCPAEVGPPPPLVGLGLLVLAAITIGFTAVRRSARIRRERGQGPP